MNMRIRLCVILSLCYSSVVVSGSGLESKSSEPSQNPDPDPNPIEYVEGLVKYFKAEKERNREQAKINEQSKKNNEELKNINVELKEQLKSLSDKFEKFKEEISSDHGVWLLTPRLRGPPGRTGEKGEPGQDGKPGEKGEKGATCEQEPPGQKGETVQDGLAEEQAEPEKEPQGDPETPDPGLRLAKSCSEIQEFPPMGNTLRNETSKERIYPHGNENGTGLEVLCDFKVDGDGGGWTLIQKRSSGPQQEFYQNWNEYVAGFGSFDGNFWLGLENIRTLTKDGDQELRIDLEDFEGEKSWAKYSSFSISDASDFYRLSISGFFGNSTAGDSMTNPADGSGNNNNGARFTTKDKDHDNDPNKNCAQNDLGSWWYPSSCGHSTLNGLYRTQGEIVPHYKGIIWKSWKGSTYSRAKTEMKIRKKKSA